jgi:hypothetical protein
MFEPKPHTVVHSIVQRSLLKWWDDQRRGRIAPARGEIDPHRLAPYWDDIAMYEVVRLSDRTRYRFRVHGKGISLADGADYQGRYLDEALPADMQGSILAAYDAILALHCALYTVRPAVDANGIAVRFERLLLPFSQDGKAISDILTHIQMFCPEGRYERRKLFEAGLTYKEHTFKAALTIAPAGNAVKS